MSDTVRSGTLEKKGGEEETAVRKGVQQLGRRRKPESTGSQHKRGGGRVKINPLDIHILAGKVKGGMRIRK